MRGVGGGAAGVRGSWRVRFVKWGHSVLVVTLSLLGAHGRVGKRDYPATEQAAEKVICDAA